MRDGLVRDGVSQEHADDGTALGWTNPRGSTSTSCMDTTELARIVIERLGALLALIEEVLAEHDEGPGC